jgi:hypothetical protein
MFEDIAKNGMAAMMKVMNPIRMFAKLIDIEGTGELQPSPSSMADSSRVQLVLNGFSFCLAMTLQCWSET